jgi:hypothetical protein
MAIWVKIECSGTEHAIGLEAGSRPIIDEDAHDIEMEQALVALGAEPPRCLQLHQEYSTGLTLAATALYQYTHDFKYLDLYNLGWQVARALETPDGTESLYAGIYYSEHVDEDIARLLQEAREGHYVDMSNWSHSNDKDIIHSLLDKLRTAFEEEETTTVLELVKLLTDLFPENDPWGLYEHDQIYDHGLDGGTIFESTRELTFFDQPVVEWKRMWERRFFDEISFHQYDTEDQCEENSDFCTPEAVGFALMLLGIEEDESPEIPDAELDVRPDFTCDDCEYGVFYEPDLSNPYMQGPEWRETTVAPYDEFWQTLKAMEQSQTLSDIRADGNLYIMTPVRRVSEKKFARIVRMVEEDRASRRLFSKADVPPLTDVDYLKMQWEPWTEEQEEALQAGDIDEDEL